LLLAANGFTVSIAVLSAGVEPSARACATVISTCPRRDDLDQPGRDDLDEPRDADNVQPTPLPKVLT
jgi:hypothetical protein